MGSSALLIQQSRAHSCACISTTACGGQIVIFGDLVNLATKKQTFEHYLHYYRTQNVNLRTCLVLLLCPKTTDPDWMKQLLNCTHYVHWFTNKPFFWNRHFFSPQSYSVVVLLEWLFLQTVCTRHVYLRSNTAFRRYCAGKLQPDDRIKNKQGQMLSEMWLWNLF